VYYSYLPHSIFFDNRRFGSVIFDNRRSKRARDRVPLFEAIFHHSSQVGSGATESTCHCFVQHQDQSQNNYLLQWFKRQGLHPLRWFNHQGLHPLQSTQCFHHQGLHPLQSTYCRKWYRSRSFHPSLHIEVVKPIRLTSTSNTCEHTHQRQDVKDPAHMKPATTQLL
jgi:hypothetical protein